MGEYYRDRIPDQYDRICDRYTVRRMSFLQALFIGVSCSKEPLILFDFSRMYFEKYFFSIREFVFDIGNLGTFFT